MNNQNRTIVECKFHPKRYRAVDLVIRIEPQWNVNFKIAFKLLALLLIRIEPQWNVNPLTNSRALKVPKLEQNHSGM